MFAVQVHLILNHVPLTGLVFGLVFYMLGIKRSSEAALLTSERIFVAVGAISIAVLASGCDPHMLCRRCRGLIQQRCTRTSALAS